MCFIKHKGSERDVSCFPPKNTQGLSQLLEAGYLHTQVVFLSPIYVCTNSFIPQRELLHQGTKALNLTTLDTGKV